MNKLINRIDFYINTVNSKSAFIVTFNVFILGSILLKYEDIIKQFKNPRISLLVPVLMVVMIFGVGMSLLRVFKAVTPYMDSGNQPSSYYSLLFFSSVSKLSLDDFRNKVVNLKEKDLLEDLVRQTHVLAKGANDKFIYIKKSMFWTINFVLIPLGLLVLLKIIDWLLNIKGVLIC